ncbi:MAG: RHS repeat-associated core domain-containing protein [Thermoanaerobaculia bacterium]
MESGAAPESGWNFWSTGPYEYDGAGNITKIGPNSWTDSTEWETSDVYQYDRVNRLVSAQTTARMPGQSAPGAVQWSEAYSYDAFGNMKSKSTTKGVGTTPESMTIVPEASTNRILSYVEDGVTRSVAYDTVSGNATQVGGTVLTYDALNMVTSRALGSSTEKYFYTADDERVATTFVNGSTRYTVRGPDQKVLREYERISAGGALEWKKDYIWRNGSLLATLAPDGKTTHYHLDHLGTPRLLTDGSGNKIAMNAYLPFGEEIPDGETEGERLKFTGHERDNRDGVASQLDYMHARYYNPNLGRFLSVDPVLDQKSAAKNPQRWNRYSYVSNNPVNKIDPDGREELSEMAIMMGNDPDLASPETKQKAAVLGGGMLAGAAGVALLPELAAFAGPKLFELGMRFAPVINLFRDWGAQETGTPTPAALASQVARGSGGTLKELKKGYEVIVPHGNREIVVRMMSEGGGRTNYYRVSIPGKETFTVTGAVSTDMAKTHIDISKRAYDEIMGLIKMIRDR